MKCPTDLARYTPATSYREFFMRRIILPLAILPFLLAQTTPPATTPATQLAERVLNKEITTASGLHYHFTHLGDGPIPQTGDTLSVHGIGTFPDGKEFWNTRTEGKTWEY